MGDDILINDEALMKALGVVGNRSTRLGTRNDSRRNFTVNDTTYLDKEICYHLVENNQLLSEIVTAYPLDALRECPIWALSESEIEGDDIKNYIDGLIFEDIADQEFNGLEAVKEAQIIANIEGNAYLWLNVDDGLEYTEPIDFGRIATFTGGSIIGRDSISYQESVYANGVLIDGGYYQIQTNKYGFIDVHRSRIIPFYGSYVSGDRLHRRNHKSPSRLQSVFDKFCLMEDTLNAIYQYLNTASLFVHKFKNLAGLKTPEIIERFRLNMQAISALGGYVIDADRESLEFINRNFGGLEPLIDRTIDQFIAAAGIPRGRLFKASNQGAMSESGKSDERHWAGLVAKYQRDILSKPICRLTDLAIAALDGPSGGMAVDYELEFPSIIAETDRERAETVKLFSEADKNYFDMGLSGENIIESRFGGATFNTSITLDENFMQVDENAEMDGTPSDSMDMAETPDPQDSPEADVEDAVEKLRFGLYTPSLSEQDYELVLTDLSNEAMMALLNTKAD